uniref:Uncharacterized protein n=1 Tax=Ananas comosus var. bracteatus TaxID=296719 RepID=A0A6V7P3B3_ANACO|nr:unnamed protein product [Ananas comosus var. bracteatus]
MAAFTRISCWLWGVKDHDTSSVSPNPSPNLPSGFREFDSLQFPSVNSHRMRPSSRRIKKKRQSREERRRIDREYDVVLVPSDGGCMSGSESDGSDCRNREQLRGPRPLLWPGRHEQEEFSKNNVFGTTNDLMEENIYEKKNFIEQLLSSLESS